MLSSIITPFRWYAKYYQQNRWDIECQSVCDFQLITDQKHILPFQIKRLPSFALATDWVLRPCCNHSEQPLLNNSESIFTESWSQNAAWINNTNCEGGICANTQSGFFDTKTCYSGLTIGQTYTVNFDCFFIQKIGHASLTLIISNGGTQLNTYDVDGPFSYTFVANDTTFCFSFENPTPNASLCINNVQFIQPFQIESTDIALDISLLNFKNFGDFDIISYCGADLGQSITPGCYYSIIKDELNTLYYSEVITVQNFDPNKSPYFILEWYNSCDLTDVIYNNIRHSCLYKNKLYLPDAVLTRPTYPFKEDGEEDGNQDFNPTFQKWQKIISLFAYKLPEFIVDALTAIRLHDTINYYYPIRQKQTTLDSPITIKSIDYNLEYVVNDCFANVELKMTLEDQFVDSTCCHNLNVDCKTCSKTIPAINVQDAESYEYALMQPDSSKPAELYQYINNTWTLVGSYVNGIWISSVSSVGDVICDDALGELETGGGFQIQNNDVVQCPLITSAVFTTGQNWLFIGNLFYNTFGQIEYSIDGGTTWHAVLPKFNQSQISTGIQLNLGITCNCFFKTRMKMFDLNGCEYGTSPIKTVACQTGIGC